MYISKMFLLFQNNSKSTGKVFFNFFGEKNFHFQLSERSEPCDVFLPSRKDHSDLGNDFFSLNKFRVLIMISVVTQKSDVPEL